MEDTIEVIETISGKRHSAAKLLRRENGELRAYSADCFRADGKLTMGKNTWIRSFEIGGGYGFPDDADREGQANALRRRIKDLEEQIERTKSELRAMYAEDADGTVAGEERYRDYSPYAYATEGK